MLAINKRFLTSVSGIALTTAMALAVSTTQTQALPPTSATGTALPGNNNFGSAQAITSLQSVEDEGVDPANAVVVTGTVYGTSTFNHANAIGVQIYGWDIEASNAYDSEISVAPTFGATATNTATVTGSIVGVFGNESYAPGSDSNGVSVADDIETKSAFAFAFYGGPGYVSQTAVAQNTTSVIGTVAGSSTLSAGLTVGDAIRAGDFSFQDSAWAGVVVFGDSGFGSAHAMNVVSIIGGVGGTGASPQSVGVDALGSAYAVNAYAGGESTLYIPQLLPYSMFEGGSVVASNGAASLDLLASNAVGISGTVNGAGGEGAIGVRIGNDVFAAEAGAFGEAISFAGSTGGGVSSASAIIIASNAVTLAGAGNGLESANTGIYVGGQVFAEYASAFGEAVSGTGPSSTAHIEVRAENLVTISGTATQGNTGVYVAESTRATFAEAAGFASANFGENGNVPSAFADILIDAGNTVIIAGVATGDNAIGFQMGEGGVQAYAAEATGVVSAYAYNSATVANSAVATAEGSVAAHNGVTLTGTVNDTIANGIGIDPIFQVTADNADAQGQFNAGAFTTNETGGASATATGNVLAANTIDLSGIVGLSNSLSTGVEVVSYVEAYDAYASGSARSDAAAANSGTVGNATATANLTIGAMNGVAVSGVVGDLSTDSTGVWIGQDVSAAYAFAEGWGSAYATVNGDTVTGSGGNALASSTTTIQAMNQVAVSGIVGAESSGNTGILLGSSLSISLFPTSVEAVYAEGYGRTYASAEAGGTTSVQANATATGNVLASNGISIAGAVGAEGSNNVGVFGESGVFAGFAEAGGVVTASAVLQNQSASGSSALAQAQGLIIAQNMISISGQVGDNSYNSAGVSFGEGVVSTFAEANGSINAYASLTNSAIGDVTTQATGTIGAANQVAIGGTVGATGSESTGVWIGEGVSAFFAEAGIFPPVDIAPPGYFNSNAQHLDDTAGNATASIGDAGGASGPNRATVYANNQIVLQGGVGDSTSLAPGSNNMGIYVGGAVGSFFAEANGYFQSNALRNGAGAGNADASNYSSVSALNSVSLSGSVGQYNTDSTGLKIDNLPSYDNGVAASFAEATGYASSSAYRDGNGAGNATAHTDLTVSAANQISSIAGVVGPEGHNNTGVSVWGSVTANNAFAEGSASSYASRTGTGSGGGNASATTLLSVDAINSVMISGQVGDYNNNGKGVAILGEGSVNAYGAISFAEGSSQTYTGNPSGVGASGTQTSTSTVTANATNTIGIFGSVGSNVLGSVGVDPVSVYAGSLVGPGAYANASSFAYAIGPEGGTATANATATAINQVGITGTIGNYTGESTGVYVGDGVYAKGATAIVVAGATVDNQSSGLALTGTVSASATARNQVDIGGQIGTHSNNNTGVYVGGDVGVGGLSLGTTLGTHSSGDGLAIATATGAGLMENVVNLSGLVGSHSEGSTGVHVGGNVLFDGGVSVSQAMSLGGNASQLIKNEGFNRASIQGSVGSAAEGSYGVYIGGNVQASNSLVSNFVIAGSDSTNDGGTRGVYIGGSVLTGDAYNSLVGTGIGNSGTLSSPPVPVPTQTGDYVELAGSVYIGANNGINPYGVDVAGGNDTVLVRDTHFQMDVVNGFNGGSNQDRDGQDVITFNNAQMYVSNLDNFEKLNVTNQSFVILSNSSAYNVVDYSPSNQTAQVNVDGHSVLSFGDGGTLPPSPEVSIPVNNLTLNTEILTIGGVNGVKSGSFDDSILKAENNGNGNYTINAVVQQYNTVNITGTVYNYGTITLSKVLSVVRGTDPHGIFYNSSTSFDSPSEQIYWATHGSWAIDPTSGAGDLLTINGNYVAGSDVILDAYVFKTGSVSDAVVINGTVGGTTTVWVNNTNVTGHGAATGHGATDGIFLIDVNNNTQTPGDVAGKFVLGNTSGWNWADPVHFPEHEMQVGAYVYTLRQGGTDGKDFYLQSALLDQVPGYAVGSTALQQHFYAELGTLYQRLGELRHNDTPPRDADKVQFWLRGVGEKNSVSPSGGFDFDQTTYGFMIGGDYMWRNAISERSRLHIGGFFGYGHSKVDNVDGAAGDTGLKTDGWTVGAYATYFDTSKKGEGLYADAVLKANFMNTDYSSSSRHTSASNNDFAWGASLEAGYGFGLGGGFIIQPQGQLTYMQVTGDKFDESSPGIPLTIDRATANSLRGRLGLQLQTTFTDGTSQFSPYVIGNVIHEFMGNNKTTVADSTFRSDMGGTWYNVGGGMTVDWGNVGFYGHVEYTFGGNVEGIGGGLGFKYRW